jgi:hypothetical protein
MKYKVFNGFRYTKTTLIMVFAIQALAIFGNHTFFKAIGYPLPWQHGIALFCWFAFAASYQAWKLKSREVKS